MLKAVIFDFDGVLGDTFPELIKCVNELAPQFGYNEIKNINDARDKDTRQAVKEDLGISIPKFSAYVKKMRPLMKDRFMKAKMFKGTGKVLRELSKNYTVGILTSNYKECVEAVLGKNNMKHIDFVFDNSSLFGKHLVIRRMLKQHKFKKQEIIYVGDEVRDIEACNKTKIKMIAVTWGYNSKKILKKQKPEYLVDKPEEILKVVKSIS